jgi:Fe-S cluster biogenesis protein NfuA
MRHPGAELAEDEEEAMADQLGVQEQSGDMRERVEKVLDTIRPYVQGDGGDIELIDVVDGIVQVRLAGACVGCMHSMMTLQAGIERMLKQEIPEIRVVEAVPF